MADRLCHISIFAAKQIEADTATPLRQLPRTHPYLLAPTEPSESNDAYKLYATLEELRMGSLPTSERFGTSQPRTAIPTVETADIDSNLAYDVDDDEGAKKKRKRTPPLVAFPTDYEAVTGTRFDPRADQRVIISASIHKSGQSNIRQVEDCLAIARHWCRRDKDMLYRVAGAIKKIHASVSQAAKSGWANNWEVRRLKNCLEGDCAHMAAFSFTEHSPPDPALIL